MDIIKIENIEVFANHGVFKEENILGQKFLISLELYLNTREAGKSDNLDFSVDYGRISAVAKRFIERNVFKLIETAAEKLAEKILLEFKRIEKIKVELKKPWAPVKLHTDNISVIIERGWKTVFLSLGSNLGNKKNYLDFAVNKIGDSDFCRVKKVSDFITTKPVGEIKQDDFLNGCLEIKTIFTPYELLDFINKIEAEAGRERTIHWGPRTLDIDIIFYDNVVIYEERLKIPHSEAENRRFVLEPLCQIAPFYKHPCYEVCVKELLARLQ